MIGLIYCRLANQNCNHMFAERRAAIDLIEAVASRLRIVPERHQVYATGSGDDVSSLPAPIADAPRGEPQGARQPSRLFCLTRPPDKLAAF